MTEYTTETEKLVVDGREVRIKNRYPVLSADEEAQRKREIGARLYDIFSKYSDSAK